jgi:DNA-binding MarR family transcriptional regulator
MANLDPIAAIQKTGDLRSSTFIQIYITIRNLYKYFDTVINENTEISTIQLSVLHAITENDGSMRASDIARWLGTKRHNITTLIRRMEKSGVVTVKIAKTNRRLVQVYITEKGNLIFNNSLPIAKEAIDNVMCTFSNDELVQMQNLCAMMSASVDRAKGKKKD